ncbi:hypothetical protein HDK77DRAFT_111071 [Phyllosticta capitalensis]|uniref:Secreted protein n=1 Tax=Phyllosticta capitalensis TaxID=121624 RepID=A0ABR1YPU6_9PEZI
MNRGGRVIWRMMLLYSFHSRFLSVPPEAWCSFGSRGHILRPQHLILPADDAGADKHIHVPAYLPNIPHTHRAVCTCQNTMRRRCDHVLSLPSVRHAHRTSSSPPPPLALALVSRQGSKQATETEMANDCPDAVPRERDSCPSTTGLHLATCPAGRSASRRWQLRIPVLSTLVSTCSHGMPEAKQAAYLHAYSCDTRQSIGIGTYVHTGCVSVGVAVNGPRSVSRRREQGGDRAGCRTTNNPTQPSCDATRAPIRWFGACLSVHSFVGFVTTWFWRRTKECTDTG